MDVTLPTPPTGGQAGPVRVPVPADVLVIFPRTVIPAIALTLTVVFDTALGIGELLPASVGCTLVCTLSSAASCVILPTKLCAVSPVSCCDRIQDTTNGDQRAHPFHRNARARHFLLKILGPRIKKYIQYENVQSQSDLKEAHLLYGIQRLSSCKIISTIFLFLQYRVFQHLRTIYRVALFEKYLISIIPSNGFNVCRIKTLHERGCL